MRRIPHAIRSLARTPVFAVVAAVSLGLALALNTTMFAVVDAVAHPFTPYVKPERIMIPMIFGGGHQHPLRPEQAEQAIRGALHSASAYGTYTFLTAGVETGSIEDERRAVAVSPQFFDALGVRPITGRTFGAADLSGQSAQGAVISFSLWLRSFQQRPLARGMRVTVGGISYDVIGVMPRGVHFPFGTEVWLPSSAIVADSVHRTYGPHVVFRLRDDAPIQLARTEVALAAARLTAEHKPVNPYAVRVDPLTDWRTAARTYDSFLLVVATVLLIACANLGTMMLARGVARRRETAIRLAIGAGRGAIVADVLLECGIIVLCGIAIGMLVTIWAVYVLPHTASASLRELGDLQPVPSVRVFLFATAAAVATIVIAGLVPAMRSAATDPAEPLKDGGASTGRVRDRYNPLIIVEVALSTGLLMTAALFAIFTLRLSLFDFRYDARRLLRAPVGLTSKRPKTENADRFFRELVDRAERLPGAERAATLRPDVPAGGLIFSEEGKSGNRWINSNGYSVVSPGYLRTVGIPIVDGRDFEAGDATGKLGVVVVDENAARRLWPDLPSPVGRMIKLGNEESNEPWLRVVGVARSIEFEPRRDIDLPPDPSIYVVLTADSTPTRQLIVRTTARANTPAQTAFAVALRRQIQSASPWLYGARVEPWLAAFDDRRSTTVFLTTAFGAFGAFGLVLCAVGMYGVLAYAVSRRMREFAVRIAIGARKTDMVRIVLHDTAVTALAGIGLGAFIALAATHGLTDSMFTVHYELAIALVAAELLLLAVAVLACLGPVRQAARADPVEILRAN